MSPIFAGFNIVKFLSGFAIWKGDKLGKLIFYAVLIAVGIGIYHRAFIVPTQKVVQRTVIEKPQVVHIHQEKVEKCKDEAVFAGVKVWRLKLGVGVK